MDAKRAWLTGQTMSGSARYSVIIGVGKSKTWVWEGQGVPYLGGRRLAECRCSRVKMEVSRVHSACAFVELLYSGFFERQVCVR